MSASAESNEYYRFKGIADKIYNGREVLKA